MSSQALTHAASTQARPASSVATRTALRLGFVGLALCFVAITFLPLLVLLSGVFLLASLQILRLARS